MAGGAKEAKRESGSWSDSDSKPRCRGSGISETVRPFRQARCCTWRDGWWGLKTVGRHSPAAAEGCSWGGGGEGLGELKEEHSG